MLSYLSFQDWYLILQEKRAEIFIYQWGYLKERHFFEVPDQLTQLLSLKCPDFITILLDQADEILEAGELPKANFLDRKYLIKNHLRAKFSSEKLFGGMYSKRSQETDSYVGIAFQNFKHIKTWIEPFQEKGIKVRLGSFIIEIQRFFQKQLDNVEKEKSFILLLPWDEHLKQMLFLNGEIRYLRTIKNPSSMKEYNNEIIAFNSYVKRQKDLSTENIAVAFIRMPGIQDIPDTVNKVIAVKDLTAEIVTYIKKSRLSGFQMLEISLLGRASSKRLFYKYGVFFFFGLLILSLSLFIKHPQELKIPEKFVHFEPSQKLAKKQEVLYLGAILYVNDKNWTFWLNDKKITKPQDIQKMGYDIVQVTEHNVILRKNNSNKKRIILKPNQTFLIKEDSIKEKDLQK